MSKIRDKPIDKPISMEIKEEDGFSNWLSSIYKTDIPEVEIIAIFESLKYQGFNRKEVLLGIQKLALTKRHFIELIVLCALRGPIQASRIPLSNGQTPASLGIGSNGGQGKRILTCGKIAAATADLAAYYMKIMQVPKRISTDLPGWLQFPAAGSIRLPGNLRSLHMQFSKDFSRLIGGVFNEQIYMQMESNAYLDPNLKLFD
jgi:hypothetical protein